MIESSNTLGGDPTIEPYSTLMGHKALQGLGVHGCGVDDEAVRKTLEPPYPESINLEHTRPLLLTPPQTPENLLNPKSLNPKPMQSDAGKLSRARPSARAAGRAPSQTSHFRALALLPAAPKRVHMPHNHNIYIYIHTYIYICMHLHAHI